MNNKNNIEDIQIYQNDIIKNILIDIDKKLLEFFEPYFRQCGIKGKITFGKTKYRGIKMHVYNDYLNQTISYQLTQRGVNISPIYEIQYNLMQKI